MNDFKKIIEDMKAQYEEQKQEMLESGRTFQEGDICPWCKIDRFIIWKELFLCPSCEHLFNLDEEEDYDDWC